MYVIAGDNVLYGDIISSCSFDEAVNVARAICCAADYTLVGVMPCEVVTDHCPCVFKLHKF